MSNRTSLYAVEDGKLVRKNETCPKCGPGVFLANHPDRKSCGRCGFNLTAAAAPAPAVEEPAPAVEEVAIEAPVEEAAEEVATETESEAEADATEADADAAAEEVATETESEAEADESKEE
jgi:small subunit ribosomal protein S27Ae